MQIKKWRVYMADLNPGMGAERGKVRPVVVVQTDLLNGIHPSTGVCPLSTRVRLQARFLRVHLAAGEAGLREASDVMVDRVRAIDNRRLFRELGTITSRSRTRLASNLRILLT